MLGNHELIAKDEWEELASIIIIDIKLKFDNDNMMTDWMDNIFKKARFPQKRNRN